MEAAVSPETSEYSISTRKKNLKTKPSTKNLFLFKTLFNFGKIVIIK
jgi:hypothetical protein